MSVLISMFNKRSGFSCFPLLVWVGHGEVSIISGADGVLTTRALGHDTEGELEGFSWLHTAAYHSLEGNGSEEQRKTTGEEE